MTQYSGAYLHNGGLEILRDGLGCTHMCNEHDPLLQADRAALLQQRRHNAYSQSTCRSIRMPVACIEASIVTTWAIESFTLLTAVSFRGDETGW